MHATQPPIRPAPPVDDPYDTRAATLHRAAEYLHRHGWIQHTYYHDERPHPAACTVGALAIVAYGFPNPEPYTDVDPDDGDVCDGFDLDGWHRFVTAEAHLARFLHLDTTDGDAETLDQWNDHHRRTVGEVIATLNAAADAYDHTTLRTETAEATS